MSGAVSAPASAGAFVLEGPRRARVADLALPELADDDALLRVEACGLCGTDHEQWTGALAANVPVVPGHETVGRIEAVGAAAADRWGVSVGDRVVVEPRQACRTCPPCLAGDPRRCQRHDSQDSYGQIPLAVAPGLWGGYAEMQYLSPDSVLHRLDSDLDPVVASMFNAVANGVRWGVSVPGTGPGDVVAILGPGLRGIAAVAAAKAAGAAFVAVAGRGANATRERLAAAARFGADLLVDVAEQDPVAALMGAAGQLADVVVDATANAPVGFETAVRLAARQGRVCVAGIHGDRPVPEFRPDDIVVKELTLRGVLGATNDDFTAATALLTSRAADFASLPVVTASLRSLPALLSTMAGEGDGPPPVFAAVVPGS